MWIKFSSAKSWRNIITSKCQAIHNWQWELWRPSNFEKFVISVATKIKAFGTLLLPNQNHLFLAVDQAPYQRATLDHFWMDRWFFPTNANKNMQSQIGITPKIWGWKQPDWFETYSGSSSLMYFRIGDSRNDSFLQERIGFRRGICVLEVSSRPWIFQTPLGCACSYHKHVAISKVSLKTWTRSLIKEPPSFAMFQKIIFKPFFGSKIRLHPWCFCWPPQWSCHFELGQVHLAPWSHSNGRHWQSSPPLRSSQMGYQIKESVIGTIFLSPLFSHLWLRLTKPNRINGIWWYDWYHVINKAPIWVSLTAWSRDQSNPYDLPCGEFFVRR